MKTLRFIFGDQLNLAISSLQDVDKKNDIIFLCEVLQEANHVKHHKKKLVYIFSAMRHFKEQLDREGFNVDYIELTDAKNTGNFSDELKRALKRHNKVNKVVLTEPSEFRVLELTQEWQKNLSIPIEIRTDDRFLCTKQAFSKWASGRKVLRMEYFYRDLRKKHSILMDANKPIGGEWNYDTLNRKTPSKNTSIPEPFTAPVDSITESVMQMVDNKFSDHFGDIQPFYYAVTRQHALDSLYDFIEKRLQNFGDYQDAMLENEPWMFHSHISFYLNNGLLLPLECIQAAETAYQKKGAPLNAVEGFIRQILGWREYIRGIYWYAMPQYKQQNFLNASKKLPDFFWTGDTTMNCLKQCITETKQNAYAHHIQRLMVLGNFALLAGLDPKAVNEWYWIVYADAYEWVELPNVSGMILFADGGLLSSKPYAASGNYIHKMSNYCKNCQYDVKEKLTENACPFNSLYWNFLIKNKSKLMENSRLRLIYSRLNQWSSKQINDIKTKATEFLDRLK